MEVSGQLHALPPYPHGKSPCYIFHRSLSVPQSRSGRGGEKFPSPRRESNPRTSKKSPLLIHIFGHFHSNVFITILHYSSTRLVLANDIVPSILRKIPYRVLVSLNVLQTSAHTHNSLILSVAISYGTDFSAATGNTEKLPRDRTRYYKIQKFCDKFPFEFCFLLFILWL
jgi:hypothetical protein